MKIDFIGHLRHTIYSNGELVPESLLRVAEGIEKDDYIRIVNETGRDDIFPVLAAAVSYYGVREDKSVLVWCATKKSLKAFIKVIDSSLWFTGSPKAREVIERAQFRYGDDIDLFEILHAQVIVLPELDKHPRAFLPLKQYAIHLNGKKVICCMDQGIEGL